MRPQGSPYKNDVGARPKFLKKKKKPKSYQNLFVWARSKVIQTPRGYEFLNNKKFLYDREYVKDTWIFSGFLSLLLK